MSRYTFVAPEMTAAITGGNLYNLGLISALRDAGAGVRVIDRETALDETTSGITFVDSLYLADLQRIRRSGPLHLLAHYLPSMVEGTAPSGDERAALTASDGFLAPSDYMARSLTAWAPGRPAVVVAPAVDVGPPADGNGGGGRLRAVLVANLSPGKGVLEFVDALGRHGPPLELSVIGSFDHDPAYAAACRARATDGIIRFLGPRPHADMLQQVRASDLFVSSSRMESFGMALAEARALGVPIVARAGGNVAAHVDALAGGRLVDDAEALAAECVRLAQDPAELARRRRAAQAARVPRRSWAEAAREFLAAFG